MSKKYVTFGGRKNDIAQKPISARKMEHLSARKISQEAKYVIFQLLEERPAEGRRPS